MALSSRSLEYAARLKRLRKEYLRKPQEFLLSTQFLNRQVSIQLKSKLVLRNQIRFLKDFYLDYQFLLYPSLLACIFEDLTLFQSLSTALQALFRFQKCIFVKQ